MIAAYFGPTSSRYSRQPACAATTPGSKRACPYCGGSSSQWKRIGLLERSLAKSRVLNLGLVGGGPQQFTRIYETYARKLDPRLVIYTLFPVNDVGDAEAFDDWLAAGGSGNYQMWRIGGTDTSPNPLRRRVERSYLFAFFKATTKALRSRVQQPVRTLDIDGGRLRLMPDYIAGMANVDPDARGFTLSLEAAERAHAIAEDDGSSLLFLLLPCKEEIYLPLLNEPFLDTVQPFRDAFEERGWTVLDLKPRFEEEARRGRKLYFEIDGHPNAQGCALIAESVKAWLEQHATELGLE